MSENVACFKEYAACLKPPTADDVTLFDDAAPTKHPYFVSEIATSLFRLNSIKNIDYIAYKLNINESDPRTHLWSNLSSYK